MAKQRHVSIVLQEDIEQEWKRSGMILAHPRRNHESAFKRGSTGTYIGTVAHAHSGDVQAWNGGGVPPVRCTEQRYLLVGGQPLDELRDVCVEE